MAFLKRQSGGSKPIKGGQDFREGREGPTGEAHGIFRVVKMLYVIH